MDILIKLSYNFKRFVWSLKLKNTTIKRIWQQAELARAQQTGTSFSVKKFRSVADIETGARKQVETDVRVKPWWFVTDNGKLAISVRYGSKVLELGKGKFAVEVGTEKDLVKVLDVIKTAVSAGELDTAIENAAIKLREGFTKWSNTDCGCALVKHKQQTRWCMLKTTISQNAWVKHNTV